MADQPLIDLNHATAEELQSLPGIGEVLAERIIAARPLNSVDDLAEIDGIRPALVEQLRPLVTVTPIEAEAAEKAESTEEEAEEMSPAEPTEAPVVEETSEAEAGEAAEEEPTSPEAEGEHAAEPQAEEQPEEPPAPPSAEEEAKPTAKPEPKYITRREAWLMTLVTSAVAFFLAILLTLGVLQSINGTIHYGSAVSQQGMNRQISVIQSEIGQIQQSIDALQGQVADLQNVAQKVNELSDNQQALQQQIDEMNDTIAQIKAETQTVSKFLVGMRDLLNGLMPPPTPTVTPTPSSTETPEASATPTATPQP